MRPGSLSLPSSPKSAALLISMVCPHDTRYHGGKMDDITVIVGVAVRDGNPGGGAPYQILRSRCAPCYTDLRTQRGANTGSDPT